MMLQPLQQTAWNRQMTNALPIVFVLDSDDAARRSVEPLLLAAGWRIEWFTSAQEFLAHPPAQVASCLLTEVTLPEVDGLELQQRLATGEDGLPIVFLTRCHDVPTTVRAMKAGAVDFITKPFEDRALIAAVAKAIDRSRAALQQRAQTRELGLRYDSLTPRERDVLAGVIGGRLNKQIAVDLGISEITVKAHRGRMTKKMKARTVVELVEIARRLSASGHPSLAHAPG